MRPMTTRILLTGLIAASLAVGLAGSAAAQSVTDIRIDANTAADFTGRFSSTETVNGVVTHTEAGDIAFTQSGNQTTIPLSSSIARSTGFVQLFPGGPCDPSRPFIDDSLTTVDTAVVHYSATLPSGNMTGFSVTGFSVGFDFVNTGPGITTVLPIDQVDVIVRWENGTIARLFLKPGEPLPPGAALLSAALATPIPIPDGGNVAFDVEVAARFEVPALSGHPTTSMPCPSQSLIFTSDSGKTQLVINNLFVVVSVAETPPDLGAGSIEIVKETVPEDAQDFLFTSPQLGDFSLDDDGDATDDEAAGKLPRLKPFQNITPSTYRVVETGTSGWVLTAITCVDPDGGTVTDFTTGLANIDLDAGEHITCTFKNEKDTDDDGVIDRLDQCPGSPVAVPVDPANGCAPEQLGTITIVKDAVPDDAQDFVFSGSLGLPVTLDDDADAANPNSHTFVAFPSSSGTEYSVTESSVPGWMLRGMSCQGAPFTRLGSTLTVVLTPNARATCTWVNDKLGRITVEKKTVPQDPQDFTFRLLGLLPVKLELMLDDDGDESGDPAAGKLPRSGTFDDLEPRNDFDPYTLLETATPGWVVTGVTCRSEGHDTQVDFPGPSVPVALGPGEHIICTYTNERDSDFDGVADRFDQCFRTPPGEVVDENGCAIIQLGSITVVKHEVPDDPKGRFSFQGPVEDFGLSGGPGDDSRTFDELVPRAYTIAELFELGWDLTKIECLADGDPTPIGDVFLDAGFVTFDLDQGQHVTCTFTNLKRGSINIIKDAVPNDAQDFEFTAPGGSFSLDDDLGAVGASNVLSDSMFIPDLRANTTYFVTESRPPSGWELAAIICFPDTAARVDVLTRTAAITIDPGAGVTCFFVNVRPGDEHYLGYEVDSERPDFSGEDVRLTDQFGEEVVHVGDARMLLTPVEKRRAGREPEPILRPEEHLKCYRITGGRRIDRTVRVSNQFSAEGTLLVKDPNRLCAPASKGLEGPPVDPPRDRQHYKCYRVEEIPRLTEEVVELVDQFGTQRAVVRRAELLCNPVTKQREGREPEPPPRPGEHLVCYGIRELAPFAARRVFTLDQFGLQSVRVFDPLVLCVPSTKVEMPTP